MRPKIMFATLGVLASVALAAYATGNRPAEAGRGGAVARAGDAVVNGADARVEGGPTVAGAEAWAGGVTSVAGDGQAQGEQKQKDKEGAPPPAGKAVLKLGGDDGVEFSGTCSVGGEERELKGRVPQEFSFDLNGKEIECEVRKSGGDGVMKLSFVSGNNHVVQNTSGGGTVKFSYSGNGGQSSSTSSGVVSQSSSSSVFQSSSSSSSR